MDKPEYSPAFFTEGYYGKGERGGFPHYEYGSDEQKFQLALKMEVCNHVPHDSALFVGCARGFEVAHWYDSGKFIAEGVDVSEWAIANQIPQARYKCKHYDGAKLKFQSYQFDLVASYDVLTLVPDDMLEKLVAEMVRVAKNGIVIRIYVKNWRNLENSVDGIDGATFKLRHFWQYDKLFTQSGKFKLDWMKMHGQYEVTAVFQRA
jgi:SAM-dependent methyltransferase